MLFCGIDIGTTNLKVGLVDESARVVWLRSVPTPRLAPDTYLAVDGKALVSLIERVIIEGWSQVGKGAPLAAIATTGVGEDGVLVDEELRPVSFAIPWFDRGATEEADFIRASNAETPKAGIEMDPTRTGARWLWYRRHYPEIVRPAHCWIALTDLPAAVFAGRPFISETLAARTGCFDVAGRSWIAELLQATGAPRLPAALRASEIVGPVVSPALIESGAAGDRTLVIAGGHDHPVAASYIQRLDRAARVDSIGTANVVYGETSDTRLDRFDPEIAFTVPILAKRGLACLGVFEFSAAVRALEKRGVDIRSILALTRLPGEPGDKSDARAIFEMASFAALRMLERMDMAGVPRGPIFATGGWSRSRGLLELRASIFGEPVYILDEQEPAVAGAALIGAQGGGNMVEIRQAGTRECVEPDAVWISRYREFAAVKAAAR